MRQTDKGLASDEGRTEIHANFSTGLVEVRNYDGGRLMNYSEWSPDVAIRHAVQILTAAYSMAIPKPADDTGRKERG